jgi:hypothetical protein
MARSNIGEVSIGVCVPSKQHPLGVCHVGIVGDLANTKLSPAVIPEFKAVRDFFAFSFSFWQNCVAREEGS